MQNKTLIFSATYNEAENINEFLDLIEKLKLEADILIIDDNSPDKTWEKIEECKYPSEHSRNIEPVCSIIP